MIAKAGGGRQEARHFRKAHCYHMSEILNLALPFFGLILLGVVAARRWQAGEQGLAWLNIFLVYFSLPALIFLVELDSGRNPPAQGSAILSSPRRK